MPRFMTNLLSASCLLSALCMYGQSPTLLVDADHRQATSLNGDWHYIVDPYRNGLGAPGSTPNVKKDMPSETGFAANKHFDLGGPLLEYDFAKSPTLKVPGDWNTQAAKLYYYEGLLWYQRDFEYHARRDHKVFLHFGAVNYQASVFVNDKHVCEHEGGFTEFDCDVTEALKDGSNFAVIAVDNTRKPERVPTMKTDWWNYGGMTRDVSLIEVPSSFVDDYGMSLDRGDGADSHGHISGYVHVAGAAAGKTVTVRIPELKISKTAETDGSGKAMFSLEAAGLERWSPEHPKLYKVELEAGADKLRDDVGFRTVEVQGEKILLNGKPVSLRGVCVHAEAPYRTGRANTDKDMQTLLDWVHELNGNFVRLAHYPHDSKMTRLADKMGILVWSEVPVYWGIHWESDATFQIAKQQLDEEIRRDRNRASIILWSVANETPISEERTDFLHRLAEEARSQDGTRLITAALLPHQEKNPDGTKTIILDDPLGQYLDVIGLNEYVGWYGGVPEDLRTLVWQDPLHKPVIASEFGAGAKAGLHGDANAKFTEEYQARVYREQMAMFAKMPFVAGTTPWILMDFRSPVRLLPGVQDDFNRKGLISDQGQKKAAFQVLRDVYAARAKAGQ